MVDRDRALSVTAGWSVAVISVTVLAPYWLTATDPNRDLPLWPLAPLVGLALFGAWLGIAPARSWGPWNPDRIQRSMAARLLPQLEEFREEGMGYREGGPQGCKPNLHSWSRRVWWRLDAESSALAERFGPPVSGDVEGNQSVHEMSRRLDALTEIQEELTAILEG